MAPPNNPEAEDVMNQIGDLPRTGVVAQDSTGMIYLDIDDDFIFKALEVLRPFGYIRPAFFVCKVKGSKVDLVNLVVDLVGLRV